MTELTVKGGVVNVVIYNPLQHSYVGVGISSHYRLSNLIVEYHRRNIFTNKNFLIYGRTYSVAVVGASVHGDDGFHGDGFHEDGLKAEHSDLPLKEMILFL